MSDTEKICKTCGRIITNPNNKTGLCPKCQKTGKDIWGAVSAAGLIVLGKKFGPKMIKGAIKIIKK